MLNMPKKLIAADAVTVADLQYKDKTYPKGTKVVIPNAMDWMATGENTTGLVSVTFPDNMNRFVAQKNIQVQQAPQAPVQASLEDRTLMQEQLKQAGIKFTDKNLEDKYVGFIREGQHGGI